jgi:hypothetical protein
MLVLSVVGARFIRPAGGESYDVILRLAMS